MITIVLASIVGYILVGTFIYKAILLKCHLTQYDDWQYFVSMFWPIGIPLWGVIKSGTILFNLFSDLFDKLFNKS